jgi:hypothetical protein
MDTGTTPTPATDPAQDLGNDPFALMEAYDDSSILEEIKGRAVDTLVYELKDMIDPKTGQPVTGLSINGVRETVRSMNSRGMSAIAITDTPPFVQETEDYFQIAVYARDSKNGGGNWGIKRQVKQFKKRNGTLVEDQFALEKALSKAQRNALRGLIPEWYVREIIAAARQTGRIKSVEARANGAAHSAAAQTAAAQPGAAQGTSAQPAASQPARKHPPLSPVQRNKLTELYGTIHGGTAEQVATGLEQLFVTEFKHGMNDATYEEGARTTAQLLAELRKKTDLTQTSAAAATPAPAPAPAQPQPTPAPAATLTAVQRIKLTELWRALQPGPTTEKEALAALETVFTQKFQHGMNQATYQEGAQLTGEFLTQVRAQRNGTSQSQAEAQGLTSKSAAEPAPASELATIREFVKRHEGIYSKRPATPEQLENLRQQAAIAIGKTDVGNDDDLRHDLIQAVFGKNGLRDLSAHHLAGLRDALGNIAVQKWVNRCVAEHMAKAQATVVEPVQAVDPDWQAMGSASAPTPAPAAKAVPGLDLPPLAPSTPMPSKSPVTAAQRRLIATECAKQFTNGDLDEGAERAHDLFRQRFKHSMYEGTALEAEQLLADLQKQPA